MFKLFLSALTLLNVSLYCHTFDSAALFLNSISTREKGEMEGYLESFPYSLYEICETPEVGFFYIDNPDDFIKRYIRAGAQWEPQIIKLLRTYIRPGSTAIDIGAHIGLHTICMAACVQKHGAIYAFEPQKKLFRELIMNVELNNITNVQAFRFALGNEDKTAYIGGPSHLNEGGRGIVFTGCSDDEVLLTKLDNFNLNDVSVIKIDVEGFEDAVLDGGRETILRNQPIILIEIMGGHDHDTASKELRDKISATIIKLKNLGYIVKRISNCDYLAMPDKRHKKKHLSMLWQDVK